MFRATFSLIIRSILTVITASGFIHVCRGRLLSWMSRNWRSQFLHHDTIFTKMTNEIQLCRTIYCSLTALHVSSDIFAHHQEHLNCNYSFWFYSRVSWSWLSWLSRNWRSQFLLNHDSSRPRHTWIKPEAVITVKMLLMMSENVARNM